MDAYFLYISKTTFGYLIAYPAPGHNGPLLEFESRGFRGAYVLRNVRYVYPPLLVGKFPHCFLTSDKIQWLRVALLRFLLMRTWGSCP